MTLREQIGLVIIGQPIVSIYKLFTSEKSFKQATQVKIEKEDDFNSFSISQKRFNGYFHGHYRREFSIKPKSLFGRKNSLSNSIWIHGKIEPINEDSLNLIVTYNRTNFSKFGQWVLIGSLGLIFLLISFQTLRNLDVLNFLVFGGAIIFFYIFATFISITQTSSQIKYFEKNIIKDIKQIP